MMCQFNCGNKAVYRSRSVNLCSYCGEDQTHDSLLEAHRYALRVLGSASGYDVEQIDNGRWFVFRRN